MQSLLSRFRRWSEVRRISINFTKTKTFQNLIQSLCKIQVVRDDE